MRRLWNNLCLSIGMKSYVYGSVREDMATCLNVRVQYVYFTAIDGRRESVFLAIGHKKIQNFETTKGT